MMGKMRGWVAIIIILVLAGAGQIFGGNGWIKKGLWGAASLVAIWAGYQEVIKGD